MFGLMYLVAIIIPAILSSAPGTYGIADFLVLMRGHIGFILRKMQKIQMQKQSPQQQVLN